VDNKVGQSCWRLLTLTLHTCAAQCTVWMRMRSTNASNLCILFIHRHRIAPPGLWAGCSGHQSSVYTRRFLTFETFCTCQTCAAMESEQWCLQDSRSFAQARQASPGGSLDSPCQTGHSASFSRSQRAAICSRMRRFAGISSSHLTLSAWWPTSTHPSKGGRASSTLLYAALRCSATRLAQAVWRLFVHFRDLATAR
jgi:hypothetical protein